VPLAWRRRYYMQKRHARNRTGFLVYASYAGPVITVELPLLHGEFHLIEPPSHQSDACLATKAERTGGEGSKSVEMSVECSLALTVERASALARLLFDFVPFSTDFDRGSGAFLEGRDAAIGPKHLFVHPDIWIQDSAC